MNNRKTITMSEYRSHVDLSEGYCTECCAWTADGVEPDAHDLECPVCGALAVIGAEDVVLEGLLEVVA